MVDRLTQPAHKGAMKMIKLAVIAGILLLIACITRAAEPTLPIAPESTSYYGQEFSVDLFGGVATTDFNDERSFAGFGVNLFVNENFGIGAHTSFDETSGQFFENVALKGIYRVPVNRTALYGFVGGLRHLEEDKWGVTLGGGIQHTFARWFSPYVEIGMEKFVDIDPVAIGKIGLRFPLSLK